MSLQDRVNPSHILTGRWAAWPVATKHDAEDPSGPEAAKAPTAGALPATRASAAGVGGALPQGAPEVRNVLATAHWQRCHRRPTAFYEANVCAFSCPV